MNFPVVDLSYAIDEKSGLLGGYRTEQALRDGVDQMIDSSYNQAYLAMIKHFNGDDSDLKKCHAYIVPNKLGLFRRCSHEGRYAVRNKNFGNKYSALMYLDENPNLEKSIYLNIPPKTGFHVKVPNEAHKFLTTYSYFTNPHNLSKDNGFSTIVALACDGEWKQVLASIIRTIFRGFMFQNKTDTKGRWKTIFGKKESENELWKYLSIGDIIFPNHFSVLFRAFCYATRNKVAAAFMFPIIAICDVFLFLDMLFIQVIKSHFDKKMHNGSEFGTLCRLYFQKKTNLWTPFLWLTIKLYKYKKFGIEARCHKYFVDKYYEDGNKSGRVVGMQCYVEFLCREMNL